MLVYNFGKRGPIFKILSPIDSQENSLRAHCTISASFATYCYTIM